MRRALRAVAMIAALASAAALAGCSAASAAAPATPSASATTTIDNCGTPVRVGAPPTRIITLKSSSTELLLALGLGRHIVGAAFLDGPLPADLAAHGSPHIISTGLPDQESVLALNPDFIYADWESNFSASGVGTRAQLAQLGIGSYVSPSACEEKQYQPDPLTFDTVFTEIEQAGQIFGAQAAAAKLVAAQRATLAAQKPLAHQVSALWYSSASTTPFVGAGIGAPEMIMKAAGLKNIFADVHATWSSVSWESVAAANPQVIVLADSSWSSAAKKIGILESNPVTANLDAVVHRRFVVLPFASTEAGVRNVDAVASTLKQLHALGLT